MVWPIFPKLAAGTFTVVAEEPKSAGSVDDLMPILTEARLLAKNLTKESTRDKITGLAKQAKGRVESAAGELAGSSRLKEKGLADQEAGKTQERIGELKKARGR